MAIYRAFTKRSKGRKELTLGVHFSAVPLREMIGTQCHTTLPVLKQGKFMVFSEHKTRTTRKQYYYRKILYFIL